jgi:primase-polymerase (primpol)-like protein
MYQRAKDEFLNYEDPNWLVPIFENIPEELKEQPWAVWRAESREGHSGKFSKAPRNPIIGVKIGSNNPINFSTYEEAQRAYKDGGYTGVGLLLTGNGIIGIDIDNLEDAIQKDIALKYWIKNARKLGAYCELSPSGKGLRFFIKGNLIRRAYKATNLEIYADKRFLTITGNTISAEQGA